MKAKATFTGCNQHSQQMGGDDHLLATLTGEFQVEGNPAHKFEVTVKSPAGERYNDEPLEVSTPVGYKGPFNYSEFRKAAEKYYRTRIVSASGTPKGLVMRNNTFRTGPVVFEFEVEQTGSEGW